MAKVYEKTITTSGDFLGPYEVSQREFSVSVSGDFIGTVVLEKSHDKGKNWFEVDRMPLPLEGHAIHGGESAYYRIGIPSGKLKSGTAYVKMSI